MPMNEPLRLQQNVSANILLQRADLSTHLKNKKLNQEEKNKILFYSDLKCLREEEKQLEQPENLSLIPYHSILSALSPRYAQIFKIGEALEIPIQANFKTLFRSMMEYQPFKKHVEAPAIKEELYYYLEQKMSPPVVAETMNLLPFNFPVYHEMLHAIFYKLIPGPRKGTLHDYFQFIEALAFTQEYYIAQELGETLAALINGTNGLQRTFFKENILGKKIKDEKTIFLGLLMNNLASLHLWSAAEKAKKLPRFAPHIRSPNVGFKISFAKKMASAWIEKNSQLEYPTQLLHKKTGKYCRFTIQDFSMETFTKKEKLLTEFWLWHQNSFAL